MRFVTPSFLACVCVSVLTACMPTTTPPDPAAVEASLIAADDAFAAATAAHGLEGWLAAFDSTGIQMEPDVPFTPGLAAVRASMAPALNDTAFHLTWKPTMAFAGAAGDLGYTLGTWQASLKGADGIERVNTGKYVTIWRKQADGVWKVVFDGGSPDTKPLASVAPPSP